MQIRATPDDWNAGCVDWLVENDGGDQIWKETIIRVNINKQGLAGQDYPFC